METLMKADIFFFVTTAAIVIVSLLVIAILIYFILIMKNIFYISRSVRKQADETMDDISEIRESLKNDFNSLSGRVKEEGDEVISSFGAAHKETKKEVRRFWKLFTFILSFLTINKILKVFNNKKNDKKKK